MGRYDVAASADAPDDVTMNTILYSLGSLGNIRTETLRAFTRQETDTALAKIASLYGLADRKHGRTSCPTRAMERQTQAIESWGGSSGSGPFSAWGNRRANQEACPRLTLALVFLVASPRRGAARKGLSDTLERRSSEGQRSRLPILAAEPVRQRLD
jgi:hypothetical protein